MPSKGEISSVMAALGKQRWKRKTKAQMRRHMKMMADKATLARKKKARLAKKSLDT